MTRQHEHHVLSIANFPDRLRPLFFSGIMRFVAEGLSVLFVPLYLFSIGTTVPWFQVLGVSTLVSGIFVVALYYILVRCVVLIATAMAGVLSAIWKLPSLMMLGNICAIIRFGLLYLSTINIFFLVPSAVFLGIEIALYWPARHTLITKGITLSGVGKQIGMYEFLIRLVEICLPALSGAAVVSFGFGVSFLASSVCYVLALLPLLYLGHPHEPTHVSISGFLRWIRRTQKTTIFGLLGRFLHLNVVDVWVIFIFVSLGSVDRVGYLYSFSLLISLIVLYLAGWYFDNARSRLIFVAGGIVTSAVWLLRIGAISMQRIVILETGDRIASSLFFPGFEASLYRIGRDQPHPYAFFLYREIAISAVGVIFWAVVMGVFLLTSSPWASIYIIGAIGSLASILLFFSKRS